MSRVIKAILPAAGLGTRMRSVSGGLPKEMLVVGSKPMIQHAVEMHARSGIEEIAVILHPEKEILRDFLEGKPIPNLRADPRDSEFNHIRANLSFHFFYQLHRRGVVDAALLARGFIRQEPFAMVMPDCLLFAEQPFLAQILTHFPPQAKGVIGFIMLERERAHQFGNVGLLKVRPERGPLYRIEELSDKASGSVTFSEQTRAKGFGGGVYTADYFEYVPFALKKMGRELDDVPIHQEMAARGELFGVLLEGEAFDLGLVEGYRAASRYCSGTNGVKEN
jgi:UTP--glucose-1-phosphate uridylyltransferase